MPIGVFLLAVVSVALNALAQIFLRKTMLVAGKLPPVSKPVELGLHLAGNPWLWGGLACYGFSILMWMAVLSKAEVSTAYPLLSMGYVMAALIGIFFLGETITPLHWAGIAIICIGVFVVARAA
jgi:drug/metabolite transporter (DMT)-like permease